jgi:hypothetical protein
MAMSGAILSGGEAEVEVEGSGWKASETLGEQRGLSPLGKVLYRVPASRCFSEAGIFAHRR